MKKELSLREHLAFLLHGDGAHADFATTVKDLPVDLQGKTPKGAEHSPWQLLEHLRIAQWDVLESLRNPNHVSPEFPAGYWPATQAPPHATAWEKSIETFHADLAAILDLVSDPSTDTLAELPHSDGKTILRQVLLLADHTSYHLGQLVLVRRLLGAWPA